MNLKDPSKGVVVCMEDITERRRVLKALKNSEERYRSIINNIQEGYYEVDVAGNFIFFNESMCNILGYEKNEMMGLNNRAYTDEANARKLYRVYNEVYREGAPVKGVNWEIIRKRRHDQAPGNLRGADTGFGIKPHRFSGHYPRCDRRKAH